MHRRPLQPSNSRRGIRTFMSRVLLRDRQKKNAHPVIARIRTQFSLTKQSVSLPGEAAWSLCVCVCARTSGRFQHAGNIADPDWSQTTAGQSLLAPYTPSVRFSLVGSSRVPSNGVCGVCEDFPFITWKLSARWRGRRSIGVANYHGGI